jgi:hypothetical protein
MLFSAPSPTTDTADMQIKRCLKRMVALSHTMKLPFNFLPEIQSLRTVEIVVYVIANESDALN